MNHSYLRGFYGETEFSEWYEKNLKYELTDNRKFKFQMDYQDTKRKLKFEVKC